MCGARDHVGVVVREGRGVLIWEPGLCEGRYCLHSLLPLSQWCCFVCVVVCCWWRSWSLRPLGISVAVTTAALLTGVGVYQEERRQTKATRARQLGEKQDVQIAHNMQFAEFNAAWDKYMQEYDQMAQVIVPPTPPCARRPQSTQTAVHPGT
jgi:hypothetical protein